MGAKYPFGTFCNCCCCGFNHMSPVGKQDLCFSTADVYLLLCHTGVRNTVGDNKIISTEANYSILEGKLTLLSCHLIVRFHVKQVSEPGQLLFQRLKVRHPKR